MAKPPKKKITSEQQTKRKADATKKHAEATKKKQVERTKKNKIDEAAAAKKKKQANADEIKHAKAMAKASKPPGPGMMGSIGALGSIGATAASLQSLSPGAAANATAANATAANATAANATAANATAANATAANATAANTQGAPDEGTTADPYSPEDTAAAGSVSLPTDMPPPFNESTCAVQSKYNAAKCSAVRDARIQRECLSITDKDAMKKCIIEIDTKQAACFSNATANAESCSSGNSVPTTNVAATNDTPSNTP